MEVKLGELGDTSIRIRTIQAKERVGSDTREERKRAGRLQKICNHIFNISKK